ncbi:related to DNA polymerase zeta catalytic subunit [Saccharomycodes ludwigii]|uniref:DNA polymerase n=1 Tax=Saccharomycodes ludwigii TaxID=36035 RepID=A0A376B8G6_9ASCO|nr:related to DNA polymerase zeta catalytic subunit [Saccharomycodes ludwigii]
MDSTLDNEEVLRLQINSYDVYHVEPSPCLDGCKTMTQSETQLPKKPKPFNQVPIIRIYGCLPSGYTVLLHIHGIFPYFYINYNGTSKDSIDTINFNCELLHNLLEKKADSLFAFKNRENSNGILMDSYNYIANVEVVKGIKFYGYHTKFSCFYKISLLNEKISNKVQDILRSGQIMDFNFDIYEGHIPFFTQFCVDYNLYGCSWIKLKNFFFRDPIINNLNGMNALWDADNSLEKKFSNMNNHILPRADYPRMGRTLLEIDILPQFILNREKLEFINPLSDKNTSLHVTSTSEIWQNIQLKRSELGLPVYTAQPVLTRNSTNIKWQDDKDIEQFYQQAKRKMADGASKLKSYANVSNANMLNFLPMENEVISSLWPECTEKRLDKLFINQQYPNTVDHKIVDETNYNNVPDNQLSQDLIKNESETIDNRSSSMSHEFSLIQNFPKKRQTLSFTKTLLKRPKISNDYSGLTVYNKKHTYCYEAEEFELKFFGMNKDLESMAIPVIAYHDPYFSNPKDLEEGKIFSYADRIFKINSNHLSCRTPVKFQNILLNMPKCESRITMNTWEYIPEPPTFDEVKNTNIIKNSITQFASQIKHEENSQKEKITRMFEHNNYTKKNQIYNNLTAFHLEIHVNTRYAFYPDPKLDCISAIFWKFTNTLVDIGCSNEGIFIFDSNIDILKGKIASLFPDISIVYFDSEREMLTSLGQLILLLDPDILAGYEIHQNSWGYVIERCNICFKFDFCSEISRVQYKATNKVDDYWGYTHASAICIAGRHILNIWRILRSELNLSKYNIENVVDNVLSLRLPHYSFENLTKFWEDRDTNNHSLTVVINYWLCRVRLDDLLIDKIGFLFRTAEQARLIGIDFYSVFYRGSQYKVESILLRLCKAQHYILFSPTKTQVIKQKPLECVPLVMEPFSSFYKSPLVVLDFQSLYPSVMIAYNYCYSTILGNIRNIKEEGNKLGVVSYSLPEDIFTELSREDINISPNGIAFVKPKIRKSTLSSMLENILETRIMVKKTAESSGGKDWSLERLLNNIQFGLKLIANVTYGYTSASFSGRMPCSEIADSIVQTGREILEHAIRTIENNNEWGAKVVYGDTDSLFVYLPGKTRDEAFKCGREIAKKITSSNLAPISLKLEKVYHPCILVSKKRYVGYSYQNEADLLPNFDAKGIETIRRDGHMAQRKIMKESLKILFDTQDLSQVKAYLQSQFAKIFSGKLSIRDFCFTKEVRSGCYENESTMPPGALLARNIEKEDHRKKLQYKERMPYVIIKKPKGTKLKEKCITPEDFLQNMGTYELDTDYYITKTIIGPLNRLFNLIGIDINNWYQNEQNVFHRNSTFLNSKWTNFKRNINENSQLCDKVKSGRLIRKSLFDTLKREYELKSINDVCRNCIANVYERDSLSVSQDSISKCDSQDCAVYYSRIKILNCLNDEEHKRRVDLLKNPNKIDW